MRLAAKVTDFLLPKLQESNSKISPIRKPVSSHRSDTFCASSADRLLRGSSSCQGLPQPGLQGVSGRDCSLPEHHRGSGQCRPPPCTLGVPPQQLRLSEGGTHWTGTLSLELCLRRCRCPSPPPPAAEPPSGQDTCIQKQPTLLLLLLRFIFFLQH